MVPPCFRQENFEANVHMLKEQKCIDLIVVKILESKLIVVEPLIDALSNFLL